MAKKEKRINVSRMRDNIDNINKRMKDLYNTTYYTSTDNRDDIENISNDIENNIREIIKRNSGTDMSNLTRMYSRLKLNQEKKSAKTLSKIEEFFEDPRLTTGLLQSYMENKWLKELDDEIDIVCSYMPILEKVLEILKYATLSSDSYSKDFFSVSSLSYSQEDEAIFVNNFESLKTKYDLVNKVSDWYDEASKYGEQFVYKVPYSKAISRLIHRKNTNHSPLIQGVGTVNEVCIIENDVIKNEKLFNTIQEGDKELANKSNIRLVINNTGILNSCVEESEQLRAIYHKYKDKSMHFIYEQSMTEAKLDKTVNDDLEIPKDIDTMSKDGLINNTTISDDRVDVPGCIIKRLKRENIIPLYVDDVCLGYYYFEFKNHQGFDGYVSRLTSRNNLTGSYEGSIYKKTIEDRDEYSAKILDYVSGYLSDKISADFVNKNQDLQKEIYAILSHNDVFNNVGNTEVINVTFLPAEDVMHFAFKKDPVTHRGISDLAKGLIPAKLYACLYLSDTIGKMTRGQDKRVYYIKQNVETNISQTMLNVLSQIKKSNMNLRQIESMNNVLNLIGRYNDYFIPVGQNGESPIQFEVMQGQDINTDTELLDRLQDSAIGDIVPRELVNTIEGVDFAMQITSTNLQFLRKVYGRQSIIENLLSVFFTDIYNYEYGTNIKIQCKLPTPVFLQLTNINQILQNNRDYAQMLAELEYDDTIEDAQTLQTIFMKNLVRHNLSSYIKIDEIDKIKEKTQLEYEKRKKEQEQ